MQYTGLPTFKLSHGKTTLPKLPNNKSYFSNTDKKIDYAELKQSVPKNEAQKEVKRLLTNETVFELLSNADRTGEYKKGTGEGITREDLRKAAAKTGNKKTLEYRDIVALFIERLDNDVAQNGNKTSSKNTSVDDDDDVSKVSSDEDDESVNNKDDDDDKTKNGKSCADKKSSNTDTKHPTSEKKDDDKKPNKTDSSKHDGVKTHTNIRLKV